MRGALPTPWEGDLVTPMGILPAYEDSPESLNLLILFDRHANDMIRLFH
jgi:hypothetical protein